VSFILRLMGETLAPRNPMDDRWYGLGTSMSVAGVPVDAETAMKISAVWACVRLLSETIASLPLMVYRRLDNGGRERATNHPLFAVLHDQPNQWQTAFEFVEMLTGHALLRGNGYAEILPGPRGPVDQLVPIHPDRVAVEKLSNGRLRYQVREDNGTRRAILQDDMFHLRGLSNDGMSGLAVIDYARDSFGLTLATERYGGRFFRNDSRPGGVLRTAKTLSEPAQKRLKGNWEELHTGSNQHRVAVLEEGLEWQQIGITPEQGQFLGTREFNAEEVCRWFRVPPHMAGVTSKVTSWGTGIEQLSIGFVIYTLRPWLVRWQQAVSRDMILATDRYFAEFVVEALLRGDVKSRTSAYAVGRQWGWYSVNEIRQFENLNPIENGDVYLQPLNMSEAGIPAGEPEARPAGQANAHYRLLAEEAAGRVVRKEVAAITRAVQRDGDDWAVAAQLFYSDHVAYVAQTMRVSLEQAAAYVAQQEQELFNIGPAAMTDWETRRVADLAALALGEVAND
jgi:HK97 family phage portal protein